MGELSALVPPYGRADAVRYAQLSCNNLFHELCHRTVHGGEPVAAEALAGMCKSAFFLLQDLHALETGVFAQSRAALLAALSGQDRAVLELDAALRRGEPVDPEAASRLLFAFCRDALRRAQALLP